MAFEIELKAVTADTAVVTMSGALTLGTNLKIAEGQIQSAIHGGATRLALEMSGVPYMDSAGLGALMHVSGVTRTQGGALRLAGVSDRVRKMLEMTRTDTLLPMDADVETSLQELAKG